MTEEKQYEVCLECGNDTFKVYKEKGEVGTYQECSECGSFNYGIQEEKK